MKKIISLLLVLFVLGLSACGNKGAQIPDVSVNDMADKIAEKHIDNIRQEYKDRIEKAEDEELKKQLQEQLDQMEKGFKEGQAPGFMKTDLLAEDEESFFSLDVNKDDLEEGIIYGSAMMTRADEIVILKAKDESKVEDLKKALEKENERLEQIWSQYLPDQYEKVQNHILKTKGKYLIYIVNENPEDIEVIFDNMLKSK